MTGGCCCIGNLGEQVELTDDAIAGMEDQFQLEGVFAMGTKEGIGAERLGEE